MRGRRDPHLHRHGADGVRPVRPWFWPPVPMPRGRMPPEGPEGRALLPGRDLGEAREPQDDRAGPAGQRSMEGTLRAAPERVFKSAKESRRLDRHCVRGMVKVALHSALSLLSVQMTAAFNLTFDRPDRLRWMVPKVA